MGYILKDIAIIQEPARVSLSGLPNFIRISSKTSGGTLFQSRIVPTSSAAILVTVQDSEGGIRVLLGTTDVEAVGGSVFFISTDAMETAENLKAALLNDSYMAANFDIFSDITWPAAVNGVIIKAKDMGAEFNLIITAAGATVTAIASGTVNDTIRGNAPIVDVSADIYEESTAQYVHTGPPAGSLGKPLITLSKSYNGTPLWFDLNGIAAQNLAFAPPLVGNGIWFNTGTIKAFRALLRKGGYSQTPFFISEILYALTGFGKLDENVDLIPYVFTAASVKTLTDKPKTPYMVGQREFITFLLGAPLAGKQIGLLLRAFDGMGAYLGGITAAPSSTSVLHAVNSCAFSFNTILSQHPKAVTVSAAVTMGGALITEPQEYEVRPECLHVQNEFYFLNRLGGWDTFNFDGETVEDVKPVGETFTRTVTPTYNKAQGVEGVYLADLESVKTVQGTPVKKDVAEWLKQLVASKVILDKDGRRIIIEDFTLQVSSGELSTPIIKYRQSETFTNGY